MEGFISFSENLVVRASPTEGAPPAGGTHYNKVFMSRRFDVPCSVGSMSQFGRKGKLIYLVRLMARPETAQAEAEYFGCVDPELGSIKAGEMDRFTA